MKTIMIMLVLILSSCIAPEESSRADEWDDMDWEKEEVWQDIKEPDTPPLKQKEVKVRKSEALKRAVARQKAKDAAKAKAKKKKPKKKN